MYRDKTVTVSNSQPGIKAVIMVATYRAAAKFAEKARELYSDLILKDVSAVGRRLIPLTQVALHVVV